MLWHFDVGLGLETKSHIQQGNALLGELFLGPHLTIYFLTEKENEGWGDSRAILQMVSMQEVPGSIPENTNSQS